MSLRCARYLILSLASTYPLLLCAQTSQFLGKRIAVIQFEPEQQPLEASELHDILPMKSNTPLTMEQVRASIERLYATGRYDDIQVDAVSLGGNDVVVRFLTRPRWFVGHISVYGDISSPPNAGQIANATRLELGQIFNDDKLQQARDGIRQIMENEGLYESSVQPLYEYDSLAQQVHLTFFVSSGRRARFTDPVFRGDLQSDPQALISSTGWKHWKILGWKDVTQSRVMRGLEKVRNNYQKEGRLEAKVALQSMQYDPSSVTARPTLEVDAGPQVRVRSVGVKLSQKTLKRFVPVYEERTVDPDLLAEGQRNLRNYFQSRGYFDAQVTFQERKGQANRAEIDYIIRLGTMHRLVHIGITGNRFFSTETIRERMYILTASLLQFRHGRFSEVYLRQDQEAIENLYKSNGFRDVSVKTRVEDNYQGKRGDLAVFLEITEGPQWFVSNLEVVGVERLQRETILSKLSSVAGQPFSEFNVAIDRDTILDEYFTSGFPNVTFEWNMRPGAKPQQVELQFVIHEGKPQYVRQVLVNGLRITRPRLVNRNLLLNPGDPLSPTRMRDTQRRLYDLGIFAKVDTAIQNPDGDTPSKYVLYDMEEARRYSLAVGFGAEFARIGGSPNSLESPGGKAGFSPRVSFDISRLNIWGLGHSITFRSRISTLERRALVDYLLPRFRGNDALQLSFTALYDYTRDVRTFTATRAEGSVQLSQRMSKSITLLYRYNYRRVSVDSVKITQLVIPLVTQPVRLGSFSGTFIQDRRDDPIDSHKGIYNTLDLGLAEKGFGSQRNFLRFLGRNSTYHPIGHKLVFARNTTFGVIQPFHFTGDPAQAIPLPERFFSGGANSMRGFPENQAGPRDPITGFPLGGNALLANQAEIRFPLIGENISGVGFYDAGNVYSNVDQISFRSHQRELPNHERDLTDFDYMVHSVGFGVRYRTPIGPVRIDLGYSLNPPRFFGFKGTLTDLINAGVNPCETAPAKCVQHGISHFQFFFSIGQTF
ncbi:MAG TPA: BamA/TamA family outer membrane protein [Bryobacteraceae bacterium]|nr:BamA/TamA family outer membrane protein [Bryobacteraceae bacterium]